MILYLRLVAKNDKRLTAEKNAKLVKCLKTVSAEQMTDKPSNDRLKHTKTRSQSLHMDDRKILQQSWKYPGKQISVLLNKDDESILQQIMNITNCKITINKDDKDETKMTQITLEGTSDEIFNAHKEINHIRQHNRVMSNAERKKKRFGERGLPS